MMNVLILTSILHKVCLLLQLLFVTNNVTTVSVTCYCLQSHGTAGATLLRFTFLLLYGADHYQCSEPASTNLFCNLSQCDECEGAL